MGIREAINKNPALGGVVVAGFLVLAVVVYFLMQTKEIDPYDRSQLWYYDLNTGKPFAMAYSEKVEAPPNEAPSGPLTEDNGLLKKGEPAGVRLHRFGCGGCKEGEVFDGYLKTYSVNARQKFLDEKVSMPSIQDEIVIRKVDGGDWVPEHTPEAQAILLEVTKRCRSKNLKPRACEVNDK